MVRYFSDDGIFDGPLDKVWKLIEAHSPANVHNIHASFVSMKLLEEKDGSVVVETSIRGPDGKVAPVRMRISPHPPTSQTVEFLTGPFAGSWSTNTYVPEGRRTRVVTAGDFRVAGVADERAVLKIVDDWMNLGFEEDNAYLRKMG